MYLGLPIISYNVSYNRTTTEEKALYFEDHTDLKVLIESTPIKHLKEKGELMRDIALRRYTWSFIAKKYKALVTEALAIKKKVDVKPQSSNLELSNLLGVQAGHLKYQQTFFEKR